METKLPFQYYLITDRRKCAPRKLSDVVEEGCRAGIKAVQLREKDLSARELYQLASTLRDITARFGTQLFINDRADVAMAVGADGVHCRETSMPSNQIKRLDSKLMVGASVHSEKSARRAEKEEADFLLFGPVFYTQSKAKYGEPQGLEKLALICNSVSIPVYVVGGISVDRARESLQHGAHGVAGISSIMAADDVAEKVLEWKEFLGEL